MAKRLIESSSTATRIYRMKESEFNRSQFTKGPSYLQSGLFDLKDIISYSSSLSEDEIPEVRDVYNIKDNVSTPPAPLSSRSDSVTAGVFSERPPYLALMDSTTEFYPMGMDMKYYRRDAYMANDPSIPTPEEDTMDTDGNGLFGNNSEYSRSLDVFPMGACHSSSRARDFNLLHFDNGKDGWESNWNINEDAPKEGMFFAYDMVELESGRSHSFTKSSISLESNTTYCLSFFSRICDENPSDVDTRDGEKLRCTISAYIAGTSGSFTTNTFWNRNFMMFTTGGSTGSTVSASLSISVPSTSRPVRISGMMISKGDWPVPYDRRRVEYREGEISNAQSSVEYYPLVVKSGKLSMSSPWTVMYFRYLEGPSDSSCPMFDHMGGSSFGYKNGKVMVNGSYEGISIDASSFIGHQEIVFLTHNEDSLSMVMNVHSSSGGSYSVSVPLSSVSNTYDGVEYNVMLGSNSLDGDGYGYYRDMCIVPRVLTSDEMKKIMSSFFDVSVSGDFNYSRDYYYEPSSYSSITWSGLISLTSSRKGDAYRLSDEGGASYGYHQGNIMVCDQGFNSAISPEQIGFYWTRTPVKTEETIISGNTLMRAGRIIEGYIGE